MEKWLKWKIVKYRLDGVQPIGWLLKQLKQPMRENTAASRKIRKEPRGAQLISPYKQIQFLKFQLNSNKQGLLYYSRYVLIVTIFDFFCQILEKKISMIMRFWVIH